MCLSWKVNLCLDSTQSSYSKLQKLKGTLNENALVDADAAPTQAQTQVISTNSIIILILTI